MVGDRHTEKDTPIRWFTLQILTATLDLTGLKPGGRNSVRAYHMGDKNPIWLVTSCPPFRIWLNGKLESKARTEMELRFSHVRQNNLNCQAQCLPLLCISINVFQSIWARGKNLMEEIPADSLWSAGNLELPNFLVFFFHMLTISHPYVEESC